MRTKVATYAVSLLEVRAWRREFCNTLHKSLNPIKGDNMNAFTDQRESDNQQEEYTQEPISTNPHIKEPNLIIKELWEKEFTCQAISDILQSSYGININKTAVYRKIYKMKIPLKNRTWTPEENQKITELHQKGKTIAQIAFFMNASENQISGKIIRLKLTKRRIWTPEEHTIINQYIINQKNNHVMDSDIKELMTKLPNRTNRAIENKIYSRLYVKPITKKETTYTTPTNRKRFKQA